MKFSTRNAFYLRASNYRVIPLFLYLDERHVDWMSDRVLQLVIAELQPKNDKKHKVYVERGDSYQYCYFLRTTTRTEVVLLKQKTFSLRPPTPPSRATPLRSATPSRRPSRQPKESPYTPSRSSRARSRSVSVREESATPIRGIEGDEDGDEAMGSGVGFVEDEEEERDIKDWKPDIDVSYKGFGTSSLQLVLIVEPYPPLPASQYAPPTSRLSARSTSIASSRSRSRQTSGIGGTTGKSSSRYSSMSRSIAPQGGIGTRNSVTPAPNMRNPTRSISAIPNSRQGGSSGQSAGSSTPRTRGMSNVTPTPEPGFSGDGREETPLFLREGSATPTLGFGDTPFGQEDEDEEAHTAYLTALREGRWRLPSVSASGGGRGRGEGEGRRSVRRDVLDDDYDEEGDDGEDVPESLEAMSGRLVRSSQIEEGILRVQGGWEERGEGEESAVMGREEPGD